MIDPLANTKLIHKMSINNIRLIHKYVLPFHTQYQLYVAA